MRDDVGTGNGIRRWTSAGVAAVASCARKLLKTTSARALAAGAHTQARGRARFSRLCALPCVLVVSGCAGSAPQVETRSEPVHTPAQMCHIDRALLTPAHAPDCGFGRADLKTVDPEQWARLKLEFERKCYQNAEKIARERLRRLQVAARCEVQTAQR